MPPMRRVQPARMAEPVTSASAARIMVTPEIIVHPDPLPQALVLTAIVIGFGMTAYVIVLAVKAYGELQHDHVDGEGDA